MHAGVLVTGIDHGMSFFTSQWTAATQWPNNRFNA